MKNYLLPLILLCAHAVAAQPVWSPHTLAVRENDWMRDSLHLSAKNLQKALSISEAYYDAAAQNRQDTLVQKKAAKKKDAAMKPLLSHTQYQQYYRREQELRQAAKIKYDGKHQPY